MLCTRSTIAVRAPVRAARGLPVVASRPDLRNVRLASTTPESTPETSESVKQLQESTDKAVSWLKDKWQSTEDSEKPAAVAITVGAVVAQIAIGATIDAVDKIPVVRETLELLGLAVTGVFAYRYITDPDERESVKKSIDAFFNSVTGK